MHTFCSTTEYWICAETQRARGAPATEARLITSGWNDTAFCLSSRLTILRPCSVMACASKFKMLSMTPRLLRNFFMEFHVVS